jgi:hypothetical protein
MTRHRIGEKVKVRYTDGRFEYTLDVEVVNICNPDEFMGRVERVFAANPDKGGEITGGHVQELVGQEKIFKSLDIRK